MPAHATTVDVQDLIKLEQVGQHFADFPNGLIPPYVTDPNYVAPFNGNSLIASTIASTVLVLIVVPLRLLVRGNRSQKFWGWDDTLIVPATLIALGINALVLYEVYVGGLGYHAYDLRYAQLKLCYLLQFVGIHLYFWATLLTKLSILYFYVRLQASRASYLTRGVILFMLFLPCLTIASTFIITFNYRPIRAAWDLDAFFGTVRGKPLPISLFWLSVVYTVCDFAVWVIPIPMVWRLNMSLKKRLGLVGLFGIGLAVCVIVSVRTAIVRRALLSYDGTWTGPEVLLCNQLEACLGLIVASLPAINAKAYSVVTGCWTRVSTRMKSSQYNEFSGQKHTTRPAEKSTRSEKSAVELVRMAPHPRGTAFSPNLINVDREFIISEEYDTKAPASPKKSYVPQSWLNRNVLDFNATVDQPRISISLRSTSETPSEESLQLTIQGPKKHDVPRRDY